MGFSRAKLHSNLIILMHAEPGPIRYLRKKYDIHLSRIRVWRTAELIIPDSTKGTEVVFDQWVRAWGYRPYEGMTLKQILVDQRERELDIEEFSIWKD